MVNSNASKTKLLSSFPLSEPILLLTCITGASFKENDLLCFFGLKFSTCMELKNYIELIANLPLESWFTASYQRNISRIYQIGLHERICISFPENLAKKLHLTCNECQRFTHSLKSHQKRNAHR